MTRGFDDDDDETQFLVAPLSSVREAFPNISDYVTISMDLFY